MKIGNTTTTADAPRHRVSSALLLGHFSGRLAFEQRDLEQTQQTIAEAGRGEFATREEMLAMFSKFANPAKGKRKGKSQKQSD